MDVRKVQKTAVSAAKKTSGGQKVVAKKVAPLGVPKTGRFDVSTIVDGLANWGTEVRKVLSKRVYIDAPTPLKSVWDVPKDVGKAPAVPFPVELPAVVPLAASAPTPFMSEGAQRRHAVVLRARAARAAREAEASNLAAQPVKALEASKTSAKPLSIPRENADLPKPAPRRLGISGTYKPQVRARNIRPIVENFPVAIKEAVKEACKQKAVLGVVTTEVGDILPYVGSEPVAHCVSRDWNNHKRASAGIAAVIHGNGSCPKASEDDVISPTLACQKFNDSYVFSLLTKQNYYDKPTARSFATSLEHLRIHLKKLKLNKVYMPGVGTGRDQIPVLVALQAIDDHLVRLGISVHFVDTSQDFIEAAENFFKPTISIVAEDTWSSTLRANIREFVDRPSADTTNHKNIRKVATKTSYNEKVATSYKCATNYGGSFELLFSDFRNSIAGNATIAVVSSMDWGHVRRGDLPPLSYLYKEQGYPKPERDDLINARLAHQVIDGKSIFTMFVKQSWNAYPNLANLRQALNELADGLLTSGVESVEMPAICMSNDRLKYEDVINSILELLCYRGISVRMCTNSKAQYYSSLRILKANNSSVVRDIITDKSTPADWAPIHGNKHNHICYSCNQMYSHWHKFYNLDHPQFDRQCPNKDCVEYHKGKNPTNSQVVDNQRNLEVCMSKAFDRLSDPKWIKEASVFPAAIETAIESVARYMPRAAISLFPTNIPDLPRDEVIELKKRGYAGAVESKPVSVPTYHFSQMIGLNEPKFRLPSVKVTPEVFDPKKLKNFATQDARPIKPGHMGKWDSDTTWRYLLLSGCDGEYQGTFYRSGGTRHQHKRWSKRATEFIRYGWHRSLVNKFHPLVTDDLDEPELEHVSDPVSRPDAMRKTHKVKKAWTDEQWMEHFRRSDKDRPINITYEIAGKKVRTSRVRAYHVIKKGDKTAFDIVGPISKCAEITHRCYVADKTTRKLVKVSVNSVAELLTLFDKVEEKHRKTVVRTFNTDKVLASGSGIFNEKFELVSVVTVSDGRGKYAIVTSSSPKTLYDCVGRNCRFCTTTNTVVYHNPSSTSASGSKKKKRGSKKSRKARSNNPPVQKGAAWRDPQSVATHTANMVELKLRTERQGQELKELSERLGKVKLDNASCLASVNKMVRNAGSVLSAPTLNKPKPKKAKGKKSGSYSLMKSIGLFVCLVLLGLPMALGVPTTTRNPLSYRNVIPGAAESYKMLPPALPTTIDLDPAAKVTVAKDTFKAYSEWFRSHIDSARAYKAAITSLKEIADILRDFGDAADSETIKVQKLLEKWTEQGASISKLADECKALKAEIADLKARIEEMHKANLEAKGLFETYKERFARNAELSDYGDFEDLSSEELRIAHLNLLSAREDIIDLERTAYGGQTPSQDGHSDPERLSLLDATEAPTVKRSSATASDNNTTTDEGTVLLRVRNPEHADNKSKVTPDSEYKVVCSGSLLACDHSSVSWSLYSDWETCKTKVKGESVIGMAYGKCVIGKATFRDRYLIVEKDDTSKEKFYCSSSCFNINDIIRALRHNFENRVCTWPLLFSGHWNMKQVLDNHDIIDNYNNIVILADKISVTDNNKKEWLLQRTSNIEIVECCLGYLAGSLTERHTYYDGPCLCKANAKTINKVIKQSLTDKYMSWHSRIGSMISLQTLVTSSIVAGAFVVNPLVGVLVAIGVMAYSVNADCTLRNYHTLYVGDSNSKQLYTTLYMQVGDCFTLGENTFELQSIDNSYTYKHASTYPAGFVSMCSDIDWGCGLSEGSKVCNDYDKTCHDKCSNTANAIYKTTCLHTTTFHGDGCYGFLVQDHSVSVHGGVCLSAVALSPYDGYNKVEGLDSRKFTFKVTAFDQSRIVTIDSKASIYQDSDFTIQDIVITNDRIPHEILDAGDLLCSYTELSGNDFCRSVVDDVSKLTNPGCVNLDWTFLGDDAKWQIEDTSAVITPYIYDLFEPCEFESIVKQDNSLNVTPSGLNVVFKIDSDHRTTAITVTRCGQTLSVAEFRSSPGYVDRVQHTFISISMKAPSDCYVSLRLSSCSFISNNYCKVSGDQTLCKWAIYCPVVVDVEATIVGDSDLSSYNFTSGKFSIPTLEYGQSFYASTTNAVHSSLSSLWVGTVKVLSYVPGLSYVKSLLNISMQRVLVPLAIFLAFYICLLGGSKEGMLATVIIGWLYFFTSFVHAMESNTQSDDIDVRLWHVVVVCLLSLVNWCQVLRIIYTTLCRRINGLWCKYNFNNSVVGMPFIDWCLYVLCLLLTPLHLFYNFAFIMTLNLFHYIVEMIERPQSNMFNTEVLNHTPVSHVFCNYLSRSSQEIDTSVNMTFVEEVLDNIVSSLCLSPKTSFIGEIGRKLYNSPSNDEDEFFEIEELNIASRPDDEDDEGEIYGETDERRLSTVGEEELNTSPESDDGIEKRHLECRDTSEKSSPHPIFEVTDGFSGYNSLAQAEEEYEILKSGGLGEAAPALHHEPEVTTDDGIVVARPKRKKDALKKISLAKQVTIMLHPTLRRHYALVRSEFNRCGRVCFADNGSRFDTYIAHDEFAAKIGDVYWCNVPYTKAHLALLNVSKKDYDNMVQSVLNACGEDYITIDVPTLSPKDICGSILSRFFDNYDYNARNETALRYYINVPLGAGFEDLIGLSIPGVKVCSIEDNTKDKLKEFVDTITINDIVVSHVVEKHIPDRWVRVCSVFIKDKAYSNTSIRKHHLRVNHHALFGIIEALEKSRTGVAVKNIASLVNAIAVAANACRKRSDDMWILARPNIDNMRSTISSTSNVDIESRYYSCRLSVGDYVKLSVGKHVVSVYKDKLSAFLVDAKRQFMVFKHKNNQTVTNGKMQLGQTVAIWDFLQLIKFKKQEYVQKFNVRSTNSDIYVACDREGVNDDPNVDLMRRSVLAARMQCVEDEVKHIYVVLPDHHGKRNTAELAKFICLEFITHNIEVTVLIGSTNDVQGVVKHFHVALKTLANGEEVKFDSNLDVPKENKRKEIMDKEFKRMVDFSGVGVTPDTTYSLRIVEHDDNNYFCFVRGTIDDANWFVAKDEHTWTAWVQTHYIRPKNNERNHNQWWVYDVEKEEILGLLPVGRFRPAHFGIRWPTSQFNGEDLIGDASEGYDWGPVCGIKDKSGMGSYKTEPIPIHGGGAVSAIYTTEIEGYVGKPYVFAKHRLVSGADVFVYPRDVEPLLSNHRYCSVGFITTSSKAKVSGVEGYIHPLTGFTKYRQPCRMDYLNTNTRVAWRPQKIKELLDTTFNPYNMDIEKIGRVPIKPPIKNPLGSVIPERMKVEVDPTIEAPVIDLADEEPAELTWWEANMNFCISKAEMDCSWLQNIPQGEDPTIAPYFTCGHVVCPECIHSADEAPLLLGDGAVKWTAQHVAAKEKLFCSYACTTVHNISLHFRTTYINNPLAQRMFSEQLDINNVNRLYDFTLQVLCHPALPELERLLTAMTSTNFDRVKWYDHLLERSDSEHVFIGYQIANRDRLDRFNKELDAVCSVDFDFPDTTNGFTFVLAPIRARTILTWSRKPVSAIYINCCVEPNDRLPGKPLVVKYDLNEEGYPLSSFYVRLRRACVLLLAEGWNYIDIVWQVKTHVNVSQLASALSFNFSTFGVHTINVVYDDDTVARRIRFSNQIMTRPGLCPKELLLGSRFLMDRGAKTAIITESITGWVEAPCSIWELADTKRLGSVKSECPDVIVSQDARPDWMGDSKFSIWNMSNGIKTGTGFAVGYSVVGSNHCTLGNAIHVESPVPHGTGMNVRRANYINKLAKSFSAGDIDMHNTPFTFANPRKGEIYGVVNPAQKRGRWLMCTGVNEFDQSLQTHYNKFVPVEINFTSRSVTIAPYKLYKGLSGSPIVSNKGAIVGVYGLSSNTKYQDSNINSDSVDTTLYHSMVTDNVTESESYFVDAAKQLCDLDPTEERFCFLEAPTGTGKSTLFPLAVLEQVSKHSKITLYSICMLEPTRAAVHNCYERVIAVLDKSGPNWRKIYSVRLSTGKRGQLEGEHFKSEGAGKISLNILTYGRFIADYRADSVMPHNYDMLLMDEIHTRSKDVDVATVYLIAGDARTENVKVCYMTATSVGRVCDLRLCEGKDLVSTRFKIAEEYLVETKKVGKDNLNNKIISDSSYFTIDIKAAKLNLKSRAAYISWPRNSMKEGRCLVFLPSRNDCEKFVAWARKTYPNEREKFVSLHAGSSVADLSRLHHEAIIGCTDFASTAITVPNCKCVIDFMEDWSPTVTLFANDSGYTYRNTIAKEVVSKQVSIQRKGRTGRTCDGTYFSCSSIVPIEETKLSESMYAQIYFNLLIKMGRPRSLQAYITGHPDFDKIFDHDWLEPDALALRFSHRVGTYPTDPLRTAFNRFCVKAGEKLEIVREWDKDQLWWYLNPTVGQDYVDFCFSAENATTHGFGVSNTRVSYNLKELWYVVPTEDEADKIRADLGFNVSSYQEDMRDFDNFVQRAHDKVGAIDLYTLSKRVKNTAPKMFSKIAVKNLSKESDATTNTITEAPEDVGVDSLNQESVFGVTLGAVSVAAAIGALCSTGVFAYNHKADWQALEVYHVDKSRLAGAIRTSMLNWEYENCRPRDMQEDPILSGFDYLIEWVKDKWTDLSTFIRKILASFSIPTPVSGMNTESSFSADVVLNAVLKGLYSLKGVLVGLYLQHGHITVGGWVTAFGIGSLYNRMCDIFGVLFSNVIIALAMAASSCYVGPAQTAINGIVMVISYVINSLISSNDRPLSSGRALRASALLLTAGGATSLGLLLKGSLFFKSNVNAHSSINVNSGVLQMLNPYNTGVSKISDGVIIAKMIANMCNARCWTTTNCLASASTLMSMFFRADAMTVMVSMTAGIFLGFTRLYMANTDFWFKMTSAIGVKHAETYKELVKDNSDRFETIFETILSVAGVLANPMSLIAIISNIMADTLVAYMQDPSRDIEFKAICIDAAVFHSGVSMIYGLSCAIFKICSQLRDCVSRDFTTEGNELDFSGVLKTLCDLWGKFDIVSLFNYTKEAILKVMPSLSINFESDSTIMSYLKLLWEPVYSMIKGCYDWCIDYAKIMWCKLEKRIGRVISSAMPFSFGAQDTAGSCRTADKVCITEVYIIKCAGKFKDLMNCPYGEDVIRAAIDARYCGMAGNVEPLTPMVQWRSCAGLFGWMVLNYDLDIESTLRVLSTTTGSPDTTDTYSDCFYGRFAAKCIKCIGAVRGVNFEEFIRNSEGRFSIINESSTLDGVQGLFECEKTERSSINETNVDSSTELDSDDDAESVQSEFDIHSYVEQSKSNAFNFGWLEDLRLHASEFDYMDYHSVDRRFWIKERLQETNDRTVIPLFMQSVDPRSTKCGVIPNIICDPTSKIYHKVDSSWGSGDYVRGHLSRPWDVVCVDNVALCKLLSVVGPCSNEGTHVSLPLTMTDNSMIVMSISHSYTEKVANTGLLCQTVDRDTKEVTGDIAAVEIFTISTGEGLEMLGTCPVSTTGAWDSLFTHILMYLPFFRDIRFEHISDLTAAKSFFDGWADQAKPLEDDIALQDFLTWRETFGSRRFSRKGIFGSIKSTAGYCVSMLVSKYSKSLNESKEINEKFSNVTYLGAIRENVKYKSYYKDIANVVHNRHGPRSHDTSGLPTGIEDTRISLTTYALAAWARDIDQFGSVEHFNSEAIKVHCKPVNVRHCLNHPGAYYPSSKIEEPVDFRFPCQAKDKLARLGYIAGHNVIFLNNLGGEVTIEMASTAGLCKCTVFYVLSGATMSSSAAYQCRARFCLNPLDHWAIFSYDERNPTGDIGLGRPKMQPLYSNRNYECDTWLSGLSCDNVHQAYDLAKNLVNRLKLASVKDTVERAVETVSNFNDKINELDKPLTEAELGYYPNEVSNLGYSVFKNIEGSFDKLHKKSLRKERERITKVNADKHIYSALTDLSSVNTTPGVRRFMELRKSLGDQFFDWIRDAALDEKINRLESISYVSEEERDKLNHRYGWMTVEEMAGLHKSGMAKKDFDKFLALNIKPKLCSEAPWCDGWDKVAIRSRKDDVWLTDGNMNLYRPHIIDDDTVLRDVVRINKMVDHVPKEVWEDCRYKNRMELPKRESEIGSVYASRAACKAQLLYEYLPNFWNNHKVFFEPCCGFGGFAQYFSHQMRNMEPREYLVSSMNKKGHAQPNWSLMQAANSNCKVVRLLDNIRDGNICDPRVLDHCCSVIKSRKVTMLLFDIGERHTNPDVDDAWYLAPRNVRGGFDKEVDTWKYGYSIVGAMRKMVDALPAGADSVFKINTYSRRMEDIVHLLSCRFRKIRALKLATTPELSREWYLLCSNKVDSWEAPLERSVLLKDSVRELTWNAIYRAENMYRTKGRHATRPMSHKWFVPDTSGVCYKMIPNETTDRDDLDVSGLPQGHSINISTTTPRGDVHVDITMVPDWNRRFRCMKDYVNRINRVAKDRSNRGRDRINFDNTVRSDFDHVVGIGSFSVKSKNIVEKHTANELISSYLSATAGMNLSNSTYGHTQGTPEFIRPALKRRLDVQPGQPDPTCVIDFVKAVHCLLSEAGASQIGKFSFATKDETYSMIVKTGSTGILDPGSNLREFMEIYPEWYELAWSHILNPHLTGAPTPSYQSVRIKPEPKGRKDCEDGRLQYEKDVSIETLRAGTNISPRFIQFSDALSRIAHIIVFGKILEFHGRHKLYKGSINGTPPHIAGRVMRAYWDLHNPVSKRVCHIGNNKEMDIAIEPTPGYLFKTKDSHLESLDVQGRIGSQIYDENKSALEYQDDLPAGLTIDFSALDSTVTVSERMVMTDMWKRMFSKESEKRIVEGVCRDMTYAICLDDAGNIWVRDGQRGSGEILTSIENTWLVTANIVSAISHGLGVSIEDLTATQGYVNVLTKPGGCGSPKVNVFKEIQAGAKHKRFEFGEIPLLVDGDDVVIISTRRRINLLQEYMNGSYQWLACNRKVIRSGNKGGATRYLEFEGLSFCSHRYEAVFIGPNASKYSPKFMPRADKGRLLNRGDLLSVAEDNDFKIYFLPIRPVADILSKLMVTLKVKALKWDPSKTAPGECVDLTQSKIISYLLLYPQSRWVRYACLTLLCVTGDNFATFAEFRKRYREFNMENLNSTSMLLSSMYSLYGVSSLDDVSLREYRSDFAEIRKVYCNSRLTGHFCNTTRAKWLETSFQWLKRQQCTDVYPLMWDSSIFGHYKNWVEHSGDNKLSELQERLREHVLCTEASLNNTRCSLWERILTFTG